MGIASKHPEQIRGLFSHRQNTVTAASARWRSDVGGTASVNFAEVVPAFSLGQVKAISVCALGDFASVREDCYYRNPARG